MSSFFVKMVHLCPQEPQQSVDVALDTITPEQQKDSTSIFLDGIGPLFLMVERREQENKEIREQVEQRSIRQASRQVKPKVDTTCYICPTDEFAPLHSFLLNDNQQPKQIAGVKLYDKELYESSLYKEGRVFIETTQAQPRFVERITVKQRKEVSTQIDWLIFPLLVLFLLFGFLKVYFRQELNTLFRCAFFYYLGNKLARENSALWNRIFFMLDIIFFISISIFIVIATDFFQISLPFSQSPLIVAGFSFLGLVLFRVFRYISHKIIGHISKQHASVDELYVNQLFYPRALGFVLVPLLFFLAYSQGVGRDTMFLVSLFLFSIVLIYRAFRTIQVFIHKGYSMFYFILYLCTLEIIPVLVIVKELLRD